MAGHVYIPPPVSMGTFVPVNLPSLIVIYFLDSHSDWVKVEFQSKFNFKFPS